MSSHYPLAEASLQLATAMGVVFGADEDLTLRQVWVAIEAQVPGQRWLMRPRRPCR